MYFVSNDGLQNGHSFIFLHAYSWKDGRTSNPRKSRNNHGFQQILMILGDPHQCAARPNQRCNRAGWCLSGFRVFSACLATRSCLSNLSEGILATVKSLTPWVVKRVCSEITECAICEASCCIQTSSKLPASSTHGNVTAAKYKIWSLFWHKQARNLTTGTPEQGSKLNWQNLC